MPSSFTAVTWLALLMMMLCSIPSSSAFAVVDGPHHHHPSQSIKTSCSAMDASAVTNNDVNVEVNRRGFLKSGAAAAAVVAFGSISPAALADDSSGGDDSAPKTTLHIVDYPVQGSCGEGDVPAAGVFFAKNLGGMSDGSCASVGYTVPQGTAQGTGDKDKQRTFNIYGKS